MKNKEMDYQQLKKELLSDKEVKKEYDKLETQFSLIETLLELRNHKKLTQKQLAAKIGTKQSAIARLESGKSNPSVEFLYKIAQALGKHLEIKFT